MAASPSRPNGQTYRRVHQTRRSVVWADRAARWLIGTGGLFVIAAVMGILVFLMAVVWPLFGAPAADEPLRYARADAGAPLFLEVNEYRSLGIRLERDGALYSFDARSGAEVGRQALLPPQARVRAVSRNLDGRGLALGLDDGTLVLGRLWCEAPFLAPGPQLEAAIDLAPGHARPLEGGIVEHVGDGQFRWSVVRAELGEPLPVGGSRAPIELVDYRVSDKLETLALFQSDGTLLLSRVDKTENLLTGEITRELEEYPLPFTAAAAAPAYLLLNGGGEQLYLAWRNGELLRYDLRDPRQPRIAERLDLTPGGAELTALEFLIGEQTLIAGDSEGRVTAWFRVPAAAAEAYPDGFRLVAAHQPEAHGAAVGAIAVSPRDRSYATAAADGQVWLRHTTTDRVLLRRTAGAPVTALQIAPKADALCAWTAAEAWQWGYRARHPEVTFGTVFGATWYEGYEAPTYTWQSSSGTDDFEPKLGLVPLIFGTLKATFYAMLLSVPIALLAAIYTSEFASRRTRAVVKPAIEMMASLPSVVLGFLAALVLAPWVEQRPLGVLLCFFLVPLAAIGAAYAWLFVPPRAARRWQGLPKLLLAGGVVLAALLAAAPLARLLERWFFGGDFRAWLAPPYAGSAFGFWAALLLPPGALLAVWARRRWLDGPLAGRPAGTRGREAARECLRGSFVLAGALLCAALGAALLQGLGVDPRGGLVDTYAQRNTLVVGFVMGFAVIPIIYTIAEDALGAVPDHLRGAALGCGATPWQTAIRIVVPTAMSGIFSAIMVGLGRAVGETMIVVMAAGNTPIMELNAFNGLRALSATIAVELPEAVKDGTLYRMLFLAALTLFAMTFVVNTLAEVVRQRFRKRAFEL